MIDTRMLDAVLIIGFLSVAFMFGLNCGVFSELLRLL